MIKTAKDYLVTLGFKAVDGFWYGPNGILGPWHRGKDRATPIGTKFMLNSGIVLGLTGNTGNSSGPHVHYEEREYEGSEIKFHDPEDIWKLKEGVVTVAGYVNGFGNSVFIKSGGRQYIVAHLSKVLVKKGDRLQDMNCDKVRKENARLKKRNKELKKQRSFWINQYNKVVRAIRAVASKFKIKKD